MSRPKKKQSPQSVTSQTATTPTERHSSWRRVGLAGLAIIAVTAAFYYWTNESARASFERAAHLLATDPVQAEKLAEQAIQKAGGDYPAAQLLQCRALAAMGQWDAAYGGWSLIKDTSICAPADLLALGESALSVGQFDFAARCLRAARVPGPTLSKATELLVRLELQFQRTDEAISLCREWQQAVPDSPLPWVITGDIAKANVDLASAIADYREALRRSPSQELETEVRTSLAQLLVHSGDVTAARQEFNTLLKAGPLPDKIRLIHAQLLRTEGRLDDALKEVDKFIAEVGSTPEALKQRGIIKLDQGDIQQAVSDLKQSVQESPFDVGSQHKLAQAYLRLGQKESAQPHLEQARRLTDATLRLAEIERQLRSDPQNPAVRRELQELSETLGKKSAP